MNRPYGNIQNQIITTTTKTFELFGLTPVESQLFVYLYLTDEPQTLDEMSEALGRSKTSMSTNVRKLASLNLVSQVWKRGVRKDLYIAKTQTFNTLVNIYMQGLADIINQQKEALEDLEQTIDIQRHMHVSKDERVPFELFNKLNEIIHFHKDLQKKFDSLLNRDNTV